MTSAGAQAYLSKLETEWQWSSVLRNQMWIDRQLDQNNKVPKIVKKYRDPLGLSNYILKKTLINFVKYIQMIYALHGRYSQEQLNTLPQYQRLMQLHASLMPLLPQQMRESHEIVTANKRSPFSVEFLGIHVSYPQYLRLKILQEKVIKLDQVS